MIWNDIKINIPLFECKDSLLFDSGEVIATLTSSNGIFEGVKKAKVR